MLGRGFALGMVHCSCTLLFTKHQSPGILSRIARSKTPWNTGFSCYILSLSILKKQKPKFMPTQGNRGCPGSDYNKEGSGSGHIVVETWKLSWVLSHIQSPNYIQNVLSKLWVPIQPTEKFLRRIETQPKSKPSKTSTPCWAFTAKCMAFILLRPFLAWLLDRKLHWLTFFSELPGSLPPPRCCRPSAQHEYAEQSMTRQESQKGCIAFSKNKTTFNIVPEKQMPTGLRD